jgi:toxin ParE1/3/4
MDLHDSFQTLANSNFIGSDASELIPELRRFIYHSHMIFYFNTEYGVLILRVLHQSMDYRRHFRK